MKRRGTITRLVCALLVFATVFTFTGCEKKCEHEFELKIVTPAGPLTEGEQKQVCKLCGEEGETEVIPATKSIKILAIGNSFSDDAMSYLWQIAKDAGLETVVIANLYIGGCTLKRHWENIENDADAYDYRKNENGEWKTLSATSIYEGIKDERWDIITVQQGSHDSGKPETYSYLKDILDYVKKQAINPKLKIYWHLTWAYQSNATHPNFVDYNSDQMTMYNRIIDAYKSEVEPQELIDGVIPCGTAVQDLRTSYLGDTLTRDGYHMSMTYGRYTLGVCWFKTLIGDDLSLINWKPEGVEDIEIVKKAVTAAAENSLEVTSLA